MERKIEQEREFKNKKEFQNFWLKFQEDKFEKDWNRLKDKCRIYLETKDVKKSKLDKDQAFQRQLRFSKYTYDELCEEIIYSRATAYGAIKTQEYGDNSSYILAYFKFLLLNFSLTPKNFFNKKYHTKLNTSLAPRFIIDSNTYGAGVHFKWGGKIKAAVISYFENEIPKLIKACEENQIEIKIFWHCNDEDGFYEFVQRVKDFSSSKNLSFYHFDDIKTLSF